MSVWFCWPAFHEGPNRESVASCSMPQCRQRRPAPGATRATARTATRSSTPTTPTSTSNRLGDTYYMISSKQHMSPGMVILAIEGHGQLADDRPRVGQARWDPKYNWDRMDGYRFGVWAGDLAYHDGRWYCYQIDYDQRAVHEQRQDIRGPWTKPHLMLRKTKWTDPAVLLGRRGQTGLPGVQLRASRGWLARE